MPAAAAGAAPWPNAAISPAEHLREVFYRQVGLPCLHALQCTSSGCGCGPGCCNAAGCLEPERGLLSHGGDAVEYARESTACETNANLLPAVMQGFNDQEIVALSGAHTLGRAFHNRSGLGASLQALFADWTGCSSFQSRLACLAASALTACGLGSAVSGQQGTQVNALRAAFRWTPPRPLPTFSTQSTPHHSLTLDPAAVPARRQGDDEVHVAVPRRREDHRRLLLDHQLAQVRQRVRFCLCLVCRIGDAPSGL